MKRVQILSRRGFTLVEMLTVIFIIVLLASLATPALSRIRRKARLSACKHNMKQLSQLVAIYEMENDVWPSDLSTLLTLVDDPDERLSISVCKEASLQGLTGDHYIIGSSPREISHIGGVIGHDFHVNENLSMIDS